MAKKPEPKWLTRQQVEGIHQMQLDAHGGLPGLRDAGALESALGRPRLRWHYGEAKDVADCGAAYGFGLTKNRPFADGNKRTAFVAMATFLAWNGVTLSVEEVEVVRVMLAVADGNMSEAALADWLRRSSKRRRKAR